MESANDNIISFRDTSLSEALMRRGGHTTGKLIIQAVLNRIDRERLKTLAKFSEREVGKIAQILSGLPKYDEVERFREAMRFSSIIDASIKDKIGVLSEDQLWVLIDEVRIIKTLKAEDLENLEVGVPDGEF